MDRLTDEEVEQPVVVADADIQNVTDSIADDVQNFSDVEGEHVLEDADDVVVDDAEQLLQETEPFDGEVDGGARGLHEQVHQEDNDDSLDGAADEAVQATAEGVGQAAVVVLDQVPVVSQRFDQAGGLGQMGLIVGGLDPHVHLDGAIVLDNLLVCFTLGSGLIFGLVIVMLLVHLFRGAGLLVIRVLVMLPDRAVLGVKVLFHVFFYLLRLFGQMVCLPPTRVIRTGDLRWVLLI